MREVARDGAISVREVAERGSAGTAASGALQPPPPQQADCRHRTVVERLEADGWQWDEILETYTKLKTVAPTNPIGETLLLS